MRRVYVRRVMDGSPKLQSKNLRGVSRYRGGKAGKNVGRGGLAGGEKIMKIEDINPKKGILVFFFIGVIGGRWYLEENNREIEQLYLLKWQRHKHILGYASCYSDILLLSEILRCIS